MGDRRRVIPFLLLCGFRMHLGHGSVGLPIRGELARYENGWRRRRNINELGLSFRHQPLWILTDIVPSSSVSSALNLPQPVSQISDIDSISVNINLLS